MPNIYLERYNFKIIVCGNDSCGKTEFLKDIYAFNEKYKTSVGINLGMYKFENCLNNLDIHLIIWDLSNEERFYGLHRAFILGCSGIILFFNNNDLITLYELEKWFEIFETNPFTIPIFLINVIEYEEDNDKSFHQNYDKLTQNVVQKFILNYGIYKYFKWKLDDKVHKYEILETLGLEIYNNMPLKYNEENERLVDVLFENFKYCPICGAENHKNYIRKFYYSKNPLIIPLKEQLFDLISSEYYIKLLDKYDISIGIPCCKCYNYYFGI